MTDRAKWLLYTGVMLSPLLAPAIALADDCAADWRRAEDCLRTPGFAQGIGTGIATVVTVLVNGAVIGKTLIPPKKEGGESSDEEPAQFQFQVQTEGGRTEVIADGEDRLVISALVICNKENVDTRALTQSVQFIKEGVNVTWLKLDQPQMTGGSLCVGVTAEPPNEDSILEEGDTRVVASVTIEGRTFRGPVKIDIDDDLDMHVELMEIFD